MRRLAWVFLYLCASVPLCEHFFSHATIAKQPDPAAWGSDHVGKPVPEFASGDECLFCHRDVGPAWPSNRHGQTIRTIDPESESVAALGRLPDHKNLAREVELLLGGPLRQRFLRRSMEHGKLDLLSVEWKPAKSGPEGVLIHPDQPHWDNQTFGQKCAGCHATGIDSTKQTFAAASLDCFTCHGEVPDQHTTKGSLVFLSPHRKDSAAVVTSICASCHLRTGKSRSSGLPYPNNFVPSDNLFRDFQVDLSDAAIQSLNPADRHVQENVREVVLRGRDDLTCLTCHNIHKPSGQKHHTLADGQICLNCHTADSKKTPKKYEVHSTTCQY